MNSNIQKQFAEKTECLHRALLHAGIEVRQQVPVAPYTTIGCGGPAELLAEVSTSVNLQTALRQAKSLSYPVRVLGKGSNVLISDMGFNGLILINNSRQWQLLAPADHSKEKNSVIVRADSGCRISSLANGLLKNNIGGLEWFSGIPATVGGAIYMNIHGGDYFFGPLVHQALLTNGTRQKVVDNAYFEFAYDYSHLHNSREIVIWADLRLTRGLAAESRKLAKEWAAAKAHQPQKSAGCIFRNLTPAEQSRLQLPTPSIGYVIDKLLGLKDFQIGGARVAPAHAAFIENTGNARSSEVYALIRHIQKIAQSKLQLELKTEIELIGKFSEEPCPD